MQYNVNIRMPDNKYIDAVSEDGLKHLKVGDIVQFIRFGFARLDSIENNVYKFWFTHK